MLLGHGTLAGNRFRNLPQGGCRRATASPASPGLGLATPASSISLGLDAGRSHSRTNPRLAPHPPEEPLPGLVHDLELGFLFDHAQFVESRFFGFRHALSCNFDPFH